MEQIAIVVLLLVVLVFAVDVWTGSSEAVHASPPAPLSHVVFEGSQGLPDLELVLVDPHGEEYRPDAAGRFVLPSSLDGECFEVLDEASGELLQQWTFQRSPGTVIRVAVERAD